MDYKIWDLKKYGDKAAFISDEGITPTYVDLYHKGRELMASVTGRGIIFILCSNMVGSVMGYVSMVNNGNSLQI